MSLNNTASAERLHIAFFGMRNAGKSSLVNAVTGQELSVVSDIKGTTTDPVQKAMELLPLGAVVIIDTPGFDDEGSLGEKRVQKARQTLAKTDIAVLVVDATTGICAQDQELIELFAEREIPYLLAYSKADLLESPISLASNALCTSATTGENIHQLKEMLGSLQSQNKIEKHIVSDLLTVGDTVVLVIPIDESAPKGRLILPQQQTIRDILDAHCIAITCQDTDLTKTLAALASPPAMVITDSQAFAKVAKDTPENIPLTSFSILFARYKGELTPLVQGAAELSKLKDGDKVLIAEGCTHHRQCNDIGSVKIPAWVEEYSGVKPSFSFSSGGEFPENLKDYALVIHCGGCMLNAKEMKHRIATAKSNGVPIVNYGIAIAQMKGILARSLSLFPNIKNLLS